MKNRTKLPNIYLGVILCLIYLPIVLVVVYSFNESKISSVWGGFSLRWYETLFKDSAMFEALVNSIVLGAFLLAGGRCHRHAGGCGLHKNTGAHQNVVEYISMLPIMTPEIILGMVFMAFFSAGLPFGMTTLILAHTVFCIPYIYMLVKARLIGWIKACPKPRDLAPARRACFSTSRCRLSRRLSPPACCSALP